MLYYNNISIILLVVEIGKHDEYSLNNFGIVTIKLIGIEWTNSWSFSFVNADSTWYGLKITHFPY